MPARFILAILLTVLASKAPAEPTASLFDSHELLRFSMEVDFDALCRPSQNPDCGFLPTTLTLHGTDVPDRTLQVEIRRRGGWRAQHTNCQIPTLYMRFPPDQTAGTLFEGQTILPLTSHCGKGIAQDIVDSPVLPNRFERYVINEYMGYRLYNLFTDASLRVRLAKITYNNPKKPRRSFTHDAFFAEHFDSLARRLGATVVDQGDFDPDRIDRDAAHQLALFQYMIGNTDWSVERQDNIVLMRDPSGRDVPVLFDLDQSGLVNAHYARPASELPIQSVQQRYFMGYCMPEQEVTESFNRFSEMRTDVLTVLSQMPGLGRGDRRMSGVFLDGFFDSIESPAGQSAIIRTCRPWPVDDTDA